MESIYSEPEIQYLKSQRLARIATATRQGKPDVSPVGFEFDGMHFFIGSHSQDIFFTTRKYKNVRDGNKEVALVIDDLESIQPWKPRGMKINGAAEIVEHNGMFGPGKYLKLTPSITWSWGIKGLQQPKKENFLSRPYIGVIDN
ncbi:MAG TPA: PPOX class F420-dependent oxidoreductase [Nitrososphaeraceae archaeon]|nr:PPOX class F420-dependent oxidoreductase [Nitrososphaeraceae archaeon]